MAFLIFITSTFVATAALFAFWASRHPPAQPSIPHDSPERFNMERSAWSERPITARRGSLDEQVIADAATHCRHDSDGRSVYRG